MTQLERSDVWKRRDEAMASLNYVTDEDEAKGLKAVIEQCNLELTTNVYNPPVEVQEDGE